MSDKLSVTPYNGALLIEWTLATGNARQFNITATPLDASLQWTIPPRQARETGAVVPGSSTSFFLSHLVADCHTEYVVKVTWTDEAGADHPLGSAVTARPSGFVGTADPPLVEVVVDGAPSDFTFPGPITYNPLDQLTYCPEPLVPHTPADVATDFQPKAIEQPLLKWLVGFGNTDIPFDVQGRPTHWHLDDAYAGAGAVVLPFSYAGASLTTDAGGKPAFTVQPFSREDSVNGALDYQAYRLEQEVASIHQVWKSSPIVVLGHSYGGLITEWYWQEWWQQNKDHDGVVHVFSLDSPINGVGRADACAENNLTVLVCEQFQLQFSQPPATAYTGILWGVWSTLWDGRVAHDAVIVQVDRGEGFPYTAIYTVGDQAYYALPNAGLTDPAIPQAVFPLDAGVSYQSPCDVPSQPQSVVDNSHFLVKGCAGTIEHIQQLVQPPRVGACPMADRPCSAAGPHGPAISAASSGAADAIGFTSPPAADGRVLGGLIHADASAVPTASINGSRHVWSPDLSRQAAFDATTNALVVAVGTAAPQQVAPSAGYPTWSNDNRLAFSPSGSGIAVTDPGSLVSRTIVAHGTYPSFSPDGTMLSFRDCSSTGPTGSGPGSVDVINVDGSGLRTVGSGGCATSDAPQWSRDGRTLVYTATTTTGAGIGHESLIATALDTGAERALATGAAAYLPEISPDGATVAYVNGAGSIVLLPLDGSGPGHALAFTAPTAPAALTWAPDGQRLAILQWTAGTDPRGLMSAPIQIVDLNGSVRNTGVPADIREPIAWLPGPSPGP